MEYLEKIGTARNFDNEGEYAQTITLYKMSESAERDYMEIDEETTFCRICLNYLGAFAEYNPAPGALYHEYSCKVVDFVVVVVDTIRYNI